MSASRRMTVRKALIVGLVNLAVLLGLLEGTALVYLSGRDGAFYYTRPRPLPPVPPLDPESVGEDGNNALHPVLGFIWRPMLPVTRLAPRERLDRMVGTGVTPEWLSLRANNFGFFAARDYPYAPANEDEEFLLGIFGGSVAQWLTLQGAKRLEERLHDTRLLRGRKLRILNLAQGGFKQPQQLHTLAYFLSLGQRFDFVVNIDGFNEVVLSYLNTARNVESSLPSAQILLPIVTFLGGTTMSADHLEALMVLKTNRRHVTRLARLEERNRSAALQVLFERRLRVALSRYWNSAARLDLLSAEGERTPWVYLNDATLESASSSEEERFERIAGVWMRSSLLMGALLSAAEVPYLHVLQPNQYYSPGRRFSSEERRIAINPASSYKLPAEKGYPYLLARLSELQKNGVRVASAVSVFDGIPETIYLDSCCHYNQQGTERLVDFIADQMLRRESAQP